ncbi:MAG: universal stress protein [Alphaproteobacteria bacterium]|nr:universal stress protein [Alphaproteobacteria bacterium]MBL7097762.1 universal stress protein [Alphaproteobacteria bacterium]
MSIRSILVMLSGDDADALAMKQAFGIAKLFGAHVEAVLAQPDPALVVYAADLHQSANERADIACQKRNATQLAFLLGAKEAGAKIGTSTTRDQPGVTASYRVESGQPEQLAASLSLFADLVVLPSREVASRGALFGAFLEIVLTARCPVLLPGRKVLSLGQAPIALGWDESLPAGHALAAAFPLLEKAGSVHVLMAQRHASSEFETSELVEYLGLHGVQAEPRIVPFHGRASEALTASALQLQCNLLVLGAYGHNRTLEGIFGGATDDFTRSAPLPVLLAH